MSGLATTLVYLAVVVALLAAYKIVKARLDRGKPRLGDADAYEGNLVTPPPGEHRHRPTAGGLPGHGQATHTGGHTGNTIHIPPGVIGGGRP